MYRSSPEKSHIKDGRRKRILLTIAALVAQATGFRPLDGMCHKPRIEGLSPPSSPLVSAASRRRTFLPVLFGKSTVFLSNEQNATSVSFFETGISTMSPDGSLLNSTYNAVSTDPKEFRNALPNLPLNEVQLVALRHRIPKFIVSIQSGSGDSQSSAQYVVLWRSLVDDSPELAGFPVTFLAEQAQSMDISRDLSTNKKLSTNMQGVVDKTNVDWERILPYIDAYQFESGGGLSGLVYGIAGVSDGTRIRTTPVGDVQTTLPRNYVQTADGCFYELGKPSFVEDSDLQDYSLNGASKRWYRDGSELATSMIAKTTNSDKLTSSPVNADILQLSALTALVLGGSYVLGTLSHHLTVNVFWV